MPLTDRCHFVSPSHGPVTALLRTCASSSERRDAAHTSVAARILRELASETSDSRRHVAAGVFDLLPSLGVVARASSTGEMRRELIDAALSGKLLVLLGWRRYAPPKMVHVQNEKPIEWFPPTRSPQKEKSWIAITLVDSEGGRVAKARYRIRTSSGTVREGALDAQGEAYVDGLDPGDCKVEFPEYALEDFA